MKLFSFPTPSSLVLGCLLFSLAARASVATIQQDIADISADVAELERQLSSDDLGYVAAYAVHTAAIGLDRTLQRSARHVQSLSTTESGAPHRDGSSDEKKNGETSDETAEENGHDIHENENEIVNVNAFGQADTRLVIDALLLLEPFVERVAARLIALKPVFDGLKIGKLAREDITAVALSTHRFGEELVGMAARELREDAQRLAKKFDGRLEAARKAYAGETSDGETTEHVHGEL